MEYIGDYSRCILTHESDRLIALEGLANRLGRLQSGRYHLGIWLGQLEALLWRTVKSNAGMSGSPHLPSWTWASRPGRKKFPLSLDHIKSNGPDGVIKVTGLQDNDNTLNLEASLMECEVSSKGFVHLMRADNEVEPRPSGIARLDHGKDDQRLHCSIIATASNHRSGYKSVLGVRIPKSLCKLINLVYWTVVLMDRKPEAKPTTIGFSFSSLLRIGKITIVALAWDYSGKRT
jgi:hypothetical protein